MEEEQIRSERAEYGRSPRQMRRKKRRSRWKKAACACAVICLAAVAAFFAAQNEAAARVTLEGKNVQAMTPEELELYLQSREEEMRSQSIHITAEGVDETIDLGDLDVCADRALIDDELYLVGRRGMPWQRVEEVVSVLRFGKDVPVAFQADEEALDRAVETICSTYDHDPVNAYAVPNDDNQTVTLHEGTDRIVIDGEILKEDIKDQLRRGQGQTLEAPVSSREEAAVKKEDLKDIDAVLSYYTTHFDGSNTNRNENIKIAQNKLNHALVPPQEDFSFNEYVGTRTRDKGYKDAPVYFGNQLVPDAGGGVCQVSTTLFNAVLRAGLFIASRSPHFAPAAYVPVGMDATVADNSLDFAFTNPFQHPVYIYTVAGDNSVTTYILGNHGDTCTTTFKTIELENLPHRVIRKHKGDAAGDVREQEGYDGHRIVIRRHVAYADGDAYTDTIESMYEPNDEIIVTNGPDEETVVKTSDLEPQDILINAPHDMYAAFTS